MKYTHRAAAKSPPAVPITAAECHTSSSSSSSSRGRPQLHIIQLQHTPITKNALKIADIVGEFQNVTATADLRFCKIEPGKTRIVGEKCKTRLQSAKVSFAIESVQCTLYSIHFKKKLLVKTVRLGYRVARSGVGLLCPGVRGTAMPWEAQSLITNISHAPQICNNFLRVSRLNDILNPELNEDISITHRWTAYLQLINCHSHILWRP